MAKQKNVTFFIGNGFDLNLGLETSYGDFGSWYRFSKDKYYFLHYDEEDLKKYFFVLDPNHEKQQIVTHLGFPTLESLKPFSSPRFIEGEGKKESDILIMKFLGGAAFLRIIDSFRSLNFLKRENKEYKWKSAKFWANLEIALGEITEAMLFNPVFKTEMTDEYSPGEKTFVACKHDLETNLRCYLLNQNKRFHNAPHHKKTAAAECFVKGLLDFWKNTSEDSLRYIKEALGDFNAIEFGVVSFNYTDIVETMFKEGANGNSDDVAKLDGRKYTPIISKENFIQIHGNLNGFLVLGVDNVAQIKRKYHRNNQLTQRNLVKSKILEESGSSESKKLDELIERTSVFCIYGMSIGKSDKRWWKRIGENLALKDSKKVLVFFSYEKDYDIKTNESKLVLIDEKKKLFCDRAGISDEDRAAVWDRIIVVFNSKIFDFPRLRESIMRQPEEEVSLPEDLSGRFVVITEEKTSNR